MSNVLIELKIFDIGAKTYFIEIHESDLIIKCLVYVCGEDFFY